MIRENNLYTVTSEEDINTSSSLKLTSLNLYARLFVKILSCLFSYQQQNINFLADLWVVVLVQEKWKGDTLERRVESNRDKSRKIRLGILGLPERFQMGRKS